LTGRFRRSADHFSDLLERHPEDIVEHEREALGRPELTLVTANAIFLAPVPPGPVEIDVEVLRDGRNASQVAADVHVPGAGPALRVHGVFGRAHDTHLAFQDVPVPEVPRPHQITPGSSGRPLPTPICVPCSTRAAGPTCRSPHNRPAWADRREPQFPPIPSGSSGAA
jgi:hypothetical protein